jgi:hypothetical protein
MPSARASSITVVGTRIADQEETIGNSGRDIGDRPFRVVSAR